MTLAQYENGALRIGADALMQIARIAKCAPSIFFDGMPARALVKTAQIETAAQVDPARRLEMAKPMSEAFAKVRDAKSRRQILDQAGGALGGGAEAETKTASAE